MTKEQFKELDLREQLTNELKEKWYYQDRKWGLRINKHSVVFDNSFKFEIKYEENPFYNDSEFNDESQGNVVVYEDGDAKYQLCDADGIYDNEDKYCSNPKNILKDILVYIANCI